ncbi:MAG: hypothetical protein K6A68_03025 [Clostridiales bacterium]|nr:hypothetical protein [Clostridiales bacterium]
MERVTAIYMSGEQRVCDSWASYISTNPMSMEEAVAYVRSAVTSEVIMGHILYTDGEDALKGLSTVPRTKTRAGADPCEVSYGNIFGNGFGDYFKDSNTVNVTKSFTNPINGRQSVAFCHFITLREDKQDRSALLMRVVPLASFMQDWVFPTGDYPQSEVALLDAEGNYIIQQSSFKNANFFEFYRSYNKITPSTIPALRQQIAGEPGHLLMNNSKGEQCVAAHARVSSTDNWTIICLLPMSSLGETKLDLWLIGIVSAGLLLLLVMDLAVMIRDNRNIQIAADAAERANRAKTDFLSTMSHDIRTPMNAIIGLTTIAEKNLDDPVSIRDNLHKIGKTGNIYQEWTEELIEDFSAFASIIGAIVVYEKNERDNTKHEVMRYYPALGVRSYSKEKNTVELVSPYLAKLIEMVFTDSVRRDKNGEIVRAKKDEKILYNPAHSFLIKPSIAKHRNAAAIENVNIIVALIEQAGNSKKGQKRIIPHISAAELISRNEILKARLEQADTKSYKTKILRRCFEKTYELLKNETYLVEKYKDIEFPTVIPTVNNFRQVTLNFPHGVRKDRVEEETE